MIIIVVQRQLLSFLSVFTCWYCDHNLEGVLVRNILRRVGQRLWLR
jgi:hypothetical protein